MPWGWSEGASRTAAATPPAANSSRVRTRNLLGPNLIWLPSDRRRTFPTPPGNRTGAAGGGRSLGETSRKDSLVPARAAMVTISWPCARGMKRPSASNRSRMPLSFAVWGRRYNSRLSSWITHAGETRAICRTGWRAGTEGHAALALRAPEDGQARRAAVRRRALGCAGPAQEEGRGSSQVPDSHRLAAGRACRLGDAGCLEVGVRAADAAAQGIVARAGGKAGDARHRRIRDRWRAA